MDRWEISKDELDFDEKIGQGNFGEVWKGWVNIRILFYWVADVLYQYIFCYLHGVLTILKSQQIPYVHAPYSP